uniref:Uncharacterized protein n=1 Tax=Moumouvirus sp. 'Monve' TaxID=1128131 RepID=H2EDI9_9VIRU|nr:hypothetical protein mv_L257 [Moumouvirus Monve]
MEINILNTLDENLLNLIMLFLDDVSKFFLLRRVKKPGSFYMIQYLLLCSIIFMITIK